MYADDTTLTSTLENFGGVNDVASLERELNQEITKVYSELRTQNSELRILFDIIHVQLIETNNVGSLLL